MKKEKVVVKLGILIRNIEKCLVCLHTMSKNKMLRNFAISRFVDHSVRLSDRNIETLVIYIAIVVQE